MSTKSITSAFAALLNTVGTVAESATKLVDTAASGLDMTDAYIRKAKQKQEANNAMEMASFYENLKKESAAEQAIKDKELEQALSSDPTFAKHYQISLDKLSPIIDQLEAKYQPVN